MIKKLGFQQIKTNAEYNCVNNICNQLKKQFQKQFYSQQNIIVGKMRRLAVILTLISISLAFSINGPWKLDVDSSFKNITQNQSIIFDFSRQINNDAIKNQLSILACSIIDFSYTLDENQMLFLVKKVGINRRQCIRDQVTEIISRMDKVTFTNTFTNTLLLLSPSGKVLFKLIKVESSKKMQNFAGVWQVFSISDENTSIVVKANSTIASICSGNGVIEYSLPSQNKIEFTVKQSRGCPENDLFTSMYRSKYYRAYNDQLWFYSKEVDLLMKWANIGQIAADRPIQYLDTLISAPTAPPIVSPISPPIAPPTAPSTATSTAPAPAKVTNNDTVPVNGVNKSIMVVTNSRKQSDSLDSGSKDQISKGNQSLIANTSALITTSTSASTSNSNSNAGTNTIKNNTVQIGSINNSSTNESTPKNTSKADIKNEGYLNTIKKQDLYKKWTLYPNNNKAGQLILGMNAMTMVLPNCGMLTIIYIIKNSNLDGVIQIGITQVRYTNPACQGKNGPQEEAIKSLKYITMRMNQKQRIMQWKNKDFETLIQYS